MKKTIFALAMLASLLLSACTAEAFTDERPISPERLPAAAKTFIQQNFPDATISYAEKDGRLINVSYEVWLSNGTEIEFRGNGEWDNVDCRPNAVPEALVPAAIVQYVQTNYPGNLIVKIDKEHFGWEIELSQFHLELQFSSNGTFLRIDD